MMRLQGDTSSSSSASSISSVSSSSLDSQEISNDLAFLSSDDGTLHPYDPEDPLVFIRSQSFIASDNSISKAIFLKNYFSVLTLIEEGKSLSSRDNNYHTPLHNAVVVNHTEILELLLAQPGIDINAQNYLLETPLLMSLNLNLSDAFIMKLIDAGCDVTLANSTEQTPLHFAATRDSPLIAKTLLEKGADLNAIDFNSCTPLYEAVSCGNEEIVCMLLYYGADVSIKCDHYLTPFMHSINENKLNIAQVLVNYETDMNVVSSDGFSTLLLALNTRCEIASTVVDKGADVNWVSDDNDNAIYLSIFWDSAFMFKVLWPRFDCRLLLTMTTPFLQSYVKHCSYKAEEFVQCFNMLLQSEVAVELSTECSFSQLAKTLYRKQIRKADRVSLIHSLLSFGASVNTNDIIDVYSSYGFDDELEAFCLVDVYECSNCPERCSIPYYIFRPWKEINMDVLHHLPIPSSTVRELACQMLFFCTPSDWFRAIYLATNCFDPESNLDHAFITERFKSMCEVPSLLELSRNKSRKYLVDKFDITKSSKFFVVLERLNIPKVIKDIISLKKPLYV